MKNKIVILALVASTFVATAAAQVKEEFDNNKYIESGIVPMDQKKGFTFETEAGEFVFKPYVLIQSAAEFNYYDDEGLNLADQDNVANSGFSIPNALIGFSGSAFDRLTYNITLNAAQSGGALLQQAWVDINIQDELRFRVGKFKTPFQHAYLTTVGQTLFPSVAPSAVTAVRTNLSLDAVQPSMYTGFDVGVQAHGVLNNKLAYQVGVFNGTGISVNTATKTTSDDWKGLPSLLYAARLAYMPNGEMPTHQGDPNDLNSNKMSVALSSSYNVEGQSESSNDFRLGAEFAWIYKRLYIGAECYMLNMDWTARMYNDDNYTAWGAYAQAGYFITPKVQATFRYDFLDRNGVDLDGILNMPAIGANYFISSINLKLQAMYQYIGKWGHTSQLERNNDDMGMAYHSAKIQLQYTF